MGGGGADGAVVILGVCADDGVVKEEVDSSLQDPWDWPTGCILAKPNGDEPGDVVVPGVEVVSGEDIEDDVDCGCGATTVVAIGVTEGVGVVGFVGATG